MLPNEKFIKTSILNILEESIYLSELSCKGIESYPLQEYILQSTFIKMTGYLEQKIKCICWDIGSINYDFRYKILEKWNTLGTFSAYEKIKDVYDCIMEVINKLKPGVVIDSSLSTKMYKETKRLLKNSNLITYDEKKYVKFKKDSTFFNNKTFDNFADIYKNQLYKRRNSIAHNTKSYQRDLPRLTKLRHSSGDERDSFYHFFAILAIYDKFFSTLYKLCVEAIEENSW